MFQFRLIADIFPVRPFGIVGAGAVLGFTTGASVLSTLVTGPLVPLVAAGIVGMLNSPPTYHSWGVMGDL